MIEEKIKLYKFVMIILNSFYYSFPYYLNNILNYNLYYVKIL